MADAVLLPKFGQTVEEATIVRWLKKEGDTVNKGEVLFEIETDKAVLEAESFFQGTLLKILLPDGGTAPVSSVVGWIGKPGEAIPDKAPAPAPAAAPAPEPAPAPKPVNLSKITLEKKKPVNLTKDAGHTGFGKIVCNLNWDQKGGNTGEGGFLQRMMGSGGAIDLDLACFFEFNNGDKGVIQALGNSFGAYDRSPFCQLMGDDRTGSSSQGEFLHINGDQWALFRRVLVYAFIYEGVPSWDKAAAKINITMPGQPPLEAVIDQHLNQVCCAIAMLENKGGQLSVTKLVEFFRNQMEMDQAYGFGFRWEAGRK